MRRTFAAGPALVTLAASLLLSPESARADVQHVVARGHTIEAIAHRYHVTVEAIMDANHLKDARHLKIGETLTIPGVQAPKKGADGKPVKPTTYAMHPKTPDVVH